MFIPDLEIDPSAPEAVYLQIANGIRAAAARGAIEAGHRLPPTRELARRLGVNRNTVVAAYQTLADGGWVESHTGRGTFLKPPLPTEPASARSELDPADAWASAFTRAVEGPAVANLMSLFRMATATEGISFSGSYPAPELMPVREFGRALGRVLADSGERVLAYGPTAGAVELRESIAQLMRAADSPATAETIVITNGAQQAIDLVFHALLERGDAVILEEPTYTGALSVLGSLGARIVPVPVDDQGLRPDLLAVALERHQARLMYVQPTFHNPTTAVMGEPRRRELLALAARHRCIVVEDDWASGLQFDGAPPPTLHALDGGRRVIYLNTFSKKLLPGLRIGWVAAAPAVVERLIALKQIRDCGTSQLLQVALHGFLRDGGLERHLREILPAYRQRCDTMLAALARHFPPQTRFTRPFGGLFTWVTLPRGIDGREVFLAAQQAGVLYSRGDVFHAGSDGGHQLRLTFSAVAPAQIEAGVAVLGALIHERWPETSGPAPPRRGRRGADPVMIRSGA